MSIREAIAVLALAGGLSCGAGHGAELTAADVRAFLVEGEPGPSLFAQTDLSGIDLSGTDFRGADLFAVDFSGTDLSGSANEDNPMDIGQNAFTLWEGIGTQLSVVAWLNTGVPVQVLDLAWVALPAGSTAVLGGLGLADSKGEEFSIAGTTIPIPEPVSLSLLALGGLAVLRRKRR